MADRSYVPASWLNSIRTFLCLCKGNMSIKNAWLPALQRVHNQIIIDVFGTLQLSALTLTYLNTVQLYLEALTLANIVSDDGYLIIDQALTGQMQANQ
eukprot:10461430-Ditylum_brightwellii.AAC.1